ncbi:MAG: efflux RND transporter periplasmic adaptor subunit [Opitutales bacterium]|nr:efflux RND transporter periplasmic adaptor subunit [Opitutales bacterium]
MKAISTSISTAAYQNRWKALTVSLGLLLGIAGCSDGQSSSATHEPYPNPLKTLSVERISVPHVIEIPASVRSQTQSRIAAEIMGRIEHQNLQLGQQVDAGEILLRLHAPEIEARVEQARVAYDQARRDHEREKALLDRGAATNVGIQALEDRVAASRAQYLEAEAMLAKKEIRAPFAGSISRLYVETGELASPGYPLLELDAGGSVEIEAALPQSLRPDIQTGQKFTVKVGSQTITAVLTEISNRADPQSRTLQARFKLEQEADLSPGAFARLHLPLSSRDLVQIPTAAIRRFGQMDQVFIIEEGQARMRLVRLGNTDGEHVEILAGLAGGEVLVLNPSASLRSGQPVTTSN